MSQFKSQDRDMTNGQPDVTSDNLVEEISIVRSFSLSHINQFESLGSISQSDITEKVGYDIKKPIQNKEDALKARDWYAEYVNELPDIEDIRFGSFYRILDIVNASI